MTRASPRTSYFEPSRAEIARTALCDRARGAELLVDRYERKVNHLVGRLLSAEHDHDDVVQDIFCNIIGRITTLRDAKKLEHWVHAVIVNTCHAARRKRQVHHRFLASQANEPGLGDLTRDVETRDLLLRTRQLLQRMPPRDRTVFILHHAEGHTLSEVSELCSFSLATAKRRLASANRRFRKMVRREMR